MRALLEALMRRFKGFCTKLSDEDFRPKIILEDGTIPFLQWCHQQKCLLPSQTQGIATSEMEQKLLEPANLVSLPFFEDDQTTTITWIPHVPVRSSSFRKQDLSPLHHIFEGLQPALLV